MKYNRDNFGGKQIGSNFVAGQERLIGVLIVGMAKRFDPCIVHNGFMPHHEQKSGHLEYNFMLEEAVLGGCRTQGIVARRVGE